MSSITRRKKTIAGVAGLLLLAAPLAACGSDDGDSSSSSNDSSSSSSKPEPVAVIEQLQGENTQVALDQGFVDALGTLGLTPGVKGTAKLVGGGGTLQFPITGGNVSVFEPGSVPNYVVGQIQHEGSSFTLTAGDTTVEIGNLNVDPGVSEVYGDVAVNGKIAASSAIIFDLDGSTLMPLQTEGSNAILEGTQVLLSDTAAGLLGDTFGTDQVKGGLLIGIAKITVNTASANG